MGIGGAKKAGPGGAGFPRARSGNDLAYLYMALYESLLFTIGQFFSVNCLYEKNCT